MPGKLESLIEGRRKFFAAGAALAGAVLATGQTKKPDGTVDNSSIINVKDYGAIGNFSTDDTQAIQAAISVAFGTASSPHGTNYHLNKVLYFPAGHYRITSALGVTKLQGGRILGAGRFVTTIENVDGESVFITNGCGYSHWEGLHLKGNGAARLFDLNWNGSAGGAALQSNTFMDMFFEGGHFGIEIGRGGFMGSENLFLNCFWINNSKAGLITSNWNALQNTIVGGNFQTCGVGVWVGAGSVTSIHSVGFQQSSDYDIRTDGGARDCMVVQACRSESTNFIRNAADNIQVTGCSHITGSAKNGDFLYMLTGCGVVSACWTTQGRVRVVNDANLMLQHSKFHRPDWLQVDGLWPQPDHPNSYGVVEIEGVAFDGGAKIIYRQRITNRGRFEYAVNPI